MEPWTYIQYESDLWKLSLCGYVDAPHMHGSTGFWDFDVVQVSAWAEPTHIVVEAYAGDAPDTRTVAVGIAASHREAMALAMEFGGRFLERPELVDRCGRFGLEKVLEVV